MRVVVGPQERELEERVAERGGVLGDCTSTRIRLPLTLYIYSIMVLIHDEQH